VSAQLAPAVNTGNRRDGRRERAEQRARIAPLRQQVQRIEKRMAELTARKHVLDVALGDQTLYASENSSRLQELTGQAAALAAEHTQLEHDWLAVQTELEQASPV
jgi:ATP-binding cassette subfamily F protein 3